MEDNASCFAISSATFCKSHVLQGPLLLFLLRKCSAIAYKNAEKKKRSLLKKLKRQSIANVQYNERGAKTRTSRNMLKTRKAICKVQARLKNLRTDSFKKAACEVARTKLKTLQSLPSLTFKRRRQKGLSRIMREKHTLDFFNIICKRVEATGAKVIQRDLTVASCTP